MKIETDGVTEGTIEDFTKGHNLDILVVKNSRDQLFYSEFRGGDIKRGKWEITVYEKGHTPEEAIKDYAIQISQETLVLSAAYPDYRKEIKVWRLV